MRVRSGPKPANLIAQPAGNVAFPGTKWLPISAPAELVAAELLRRSKQGCSAAAGQGTVVTGALQGD